MLRVGLIALCAGCSFEAAGNPATDAASAIDAALPACADNGDYSRDPTSGIRLRLETADLDFTAAGAGCAAEEARLAILDSADKITFADTLNQAGRTYIGMTDAEVEGDWRWGDGTAVDLGQPPWGQGKPDGGGGQGCGTLRDDGLFDDEACDGGRDSLCECVF